MHVTSLIFLLVAVPVAFCMLTWVVATIYRLYFPEPVARVHPERSIRLPLRLKPVSMAMAVGVREIKENQRRRFSSSATHYSFSNGLSNGVPSDWVDDVWRRRN